MSARANNATPFDTLPTDVLSIIVRQMNSLPEKHLRRRRLPELEDSDQMPGMPNTNRHVRFLTLLFSEGSPFRVAAGMLVSKIKLGWPCPRTSIDLSKGLLHIGRELFEGEAKEVELGKMIFSACGPYVRSVCVVKFPEKEREPTTTSCNNSCRMSSSIVEMWNKSSSGIIVRL